MKLCLTCAKEIPKPEKLHGSNYHRTKYCSRSCADRGRSNSAAKFLSRAKRDDATGCLLWLGTVNKTGYPTASCDGKMSLVTRIVLENKIGRKLGDSECACHSCDTPKCIEPGHLWPGSRSENMRDSSKKGRIKNGNIRGSDCYNAKLCEADVLYIMRNKGINYAKTLALKFGISISAVYDIWRGRNWKHITAQGGAR